jgi:hypothetical protein
MIKENSTQHSSIYPLTMLQQGMLFHSLASPQQAIYVQQFLCDLRERLDISAFVRAWEQLVERHAILRTSFAWEGRETPVQIVHPSVKVQLSHLDWRDFSVSEQAIAREEYMRADRQLGIQFLEAPLFRLALIRLNEAHYQLLWTSHHAVLDGRSRLILLEELFEIYEALCDGRAPRLSPPVDFRVFLDWLQAQDAEASGPFWRELLAGNDQPTFLSGGIQRMNSPKQTDSVASQGQHLSAALSDSLRTLASEHGLTLNTLFLGAWAILLSRYCGKQKVIFGAARAGRGPQQRQVRQAVGLLINTVAMPVNVDPDAQVLAWLKQLNALWVAMRPHEHIPLSMIQKWSQLTPGTSLFDSLVVFENYQLNPKLQERGDRWRNRTFSLRSQSNYPLVVNVNDGRKIALKLEYDTEHFSLDFIERMVGHFVTLLEGIAADTERKLSELP